jgi:sec-independent protein translocase protein TatC
MIVAFVFIKWIFINIVFAPAHLDFPSYKYFCELGKLTGMEESLCITNLPFKVQSRQMTGQFTMSLTASFVIGLVVSFPYVAWEFWRFISPGLKAKERKYSRGVVAAVSFLFFLGVAFGYYIMCPMTVWFLSTYQITPDIYNEFDITSYVGTIVSLVLGSGLLFQFPIVVYFLTHVGILTPQFMRQYRKQAIVVILILGAIITPSPDPLSQLLISLPLYMLFEISIFISSVVVRNKKKAADAELLADQQH